MASSAVLMLESGEFSQHRIDADANATSSIAEKAKDHTPPRNLSLNTACITNCTERTPRSNRITLSTRTNLPQRKISRFGTQAIRSIQPHFMNFNFDSALQKRKQKSPKNTAHAKVSTMWTRFDACL